MTIGERIKLKRLENQMTLLEVADLIGVKEATVQRYESGEIKNLKQRTIARLAEIFHTTPAYLMGWEEKNTPNTETSVEGIDLTQSEEEIIKLLRQMDKEQIIQAILALQKLTDIALSSIPYYTFKVGKFAGEENVIISNTGYTGAGGFELYFYPNVADTIWKAVFEAGEEFDIKPIGLGARDTLRLEMGFCLYGNDLDDTTSPIEAGLGWITKFIEGKEFINRPMLEKQKAEGVTRKLVGFEMVDRGIPRHGYELVNSDGEKIGIVTSGTMSPTRKIGIGMGYVKPEYGKAGTEICIDMRGRKLKAVVVKPPFRK